MRLRIFAVSGFVPFFSCMMPAQQTPVPEPVTAINAGQVIDVESRARTGKAEFASIRAGEFADLIAVDGDPIANIRQLEQVTFVMKEGVVYKQ